MIHSAAEMPQLWLVPQLPSATGATLWFGEPAGRLLDLHGEELHV